MSGRPHIKENKKNKEDMLRWFISCLSVMWCDSQVQRRLVIHTWTTTAQAQLHFIFMYISRSSKKKKNKNEKSKSYK